VFVSEDKGESWTHLSNQGLRGAELRYLVVAPEGEYYLFAATDTGAFGFRRKENNWEKIYLGLTTSDVRQLARGPQSRHELWAITGKGVFKAMQVPSEAEDTQGELSAKEDALAVLDYFAHEPSIREVQEVAIQYAELHPEKIISWRKVAAKKAILPKLSVGLDGDKNRTLSDSVSVSSTEQSSFVGPDDKTIDDNFSWDISLTWNLGDLIWNNDQISIDSRSRNMVVLRDSILDEINRVYFERRRLQVELLLSAPEDFKEKIEKELRLQELTADIDALTGGYFSRRLENLQ
jgi:hypothetical protein